MTDPTSPRQPTNQTPPPRLQPLPSAQAQLPSTFNLELSTFNPHPVSVMIPVYNKPTFNLELSTFNPHPVSVMIPIYNKPTFNLELSTFNPYPQRGRNRLQPPTPNPQSPSPNPQFPLQNILILLFYTLLTLILTYPLIFNLATAVPNDIGDPLLNTWILAWDSHALLTDPLNLFNANIFYPLPNTLAYSEHLFSTALLALPIQLNPGEPVIAYNVSLLASFPLAAFGMYLLMLRWTRRRSAAFIAGLIFGFAPYRFAAIAHLQLLTFQWLPFTLLFLDLLLRARSTGSESPAVGARPQPAPLPLLLALTLFLLLQILASWYLALYTGLIVGSFLLAILVTGNFNKSRLSFLIMAAVTTLVLTIPFVRPYLALVDELRQARPLSLALSLAVVPTDFAAAAPFNRLFGPLTESLRTRPGFTEENMLFLGLIGPVLALVPVLMVIECCVLRTTYYVLRLTGRLRATADLLSSRFPARRSPQIEGWPPLSAPQVTLYALLAILLVSLALTLPAPYRLLAHLVPPSTIVRVPPRWIIPALFALSALAGVGYAIILERLAKKRVRSNNAPARRAPHATFHNARSAALLVLSVLFLLAEAASIPLPLAPVENQTSLKPAYRWLAGYPDPFALVELPLYSDDLPEFPEVKRIYASTLAWWPLVNGYSGYTPPRQRQLAQTLNHFPDEQSISILQTLATLPTPPHLSKPQTQKSPLPTPHSLPLLVLVHPDEYPMDRSRWETQDRWQAQRNPALYPLGQFEGDYLYQILPPQPQRFQAVPLATFGPQQKIHLLTLDIDPPPLTAPLPTSSPRLILFWQATGSPTADYTVFIHLRAPDGFIHGQADGPPVSGHYPTTAWQPTELIQDIHPLPPLDLEKIDQLAIGLYDPTTGQRLPAFDSNGRRLKEDALILPFQP